MVKAIISVFAAFLFLWSASLVFALNPPTQSSPQNNTTVSSSRLEWQTPTYSLYTNKPYNIHVDDNPDLLSPYRDYDTSNTYYTPVLSEGVWYWRVRAKDTNSTWSDWSSIWQFTLTSNPSPTPSPSPTLAPSPNPSPTPSPSLTISNLPSSVTVDQEFSVNISIVNFQPNSTYFLKGAFKLSGGANYFGLTKVGSDWVKNKQYYKDQDPITTDPSGNWNGNLTIKGDQYDTGFIGAENYIFKVGYYFDSSTVSWSNEINIFLDNPGGTTATSVPTVKPSPFPKKPDLISTKAFITEPSTGPTLKPTLTPVILGTISSIPNSLTTSNQPQQTQVAGPTLTNIFMIGGGLIIILIAILTFTFLKNGHFHNPFIKRDF